MSTTENMIPVAYNGGGTYAKIIADSISPNGDRLTTMEVRMHRFVLAEFNTHRVFSRNSASSRAIPFAKQAERVMTEPAFPVVWATEQKGMQGGAPLNALEEEAARAVWSNAADYAVRWAQQLAGLGVHKSLVNRLLEPFMFHTVIVTATEWDGFWFQRCHPAAQPEIRIVAEAMQKVYEMSTPRDIGYGGWHLPYIDADDLEAVESHMRAGLSEKNATDMLRRVSAARCARVSYLTHDGKRDVTADFALYERLVDRTDNPDDPIHWSPLEHVAVPCRRSQHYWPGREHLGNFKGWDQLRHLTGGRNA